MTQEKFAPTETQLASFWRRLMAGLLDGVIFFALGLSVFVLSARSRLFGLYLLIPWVGFVIFYRFYLLKRYGGTLGKLILGIRVRKADGSAIDAKAAFLRSVVELILAVTMYSALAFMMLRLSDAEFAAVPRTSGLGLIKREAVEQLQPWWYNILNLASSFWLWSEYLVMLTNRRRQSFQDFMANTIVVNERNR